MRQKLKRLLSLVLVFSMTMSLLSLNVRAAHGAEKEYDYVVTLDNAQEETVVEGLAEELLAQKGIAGETGTWSSDNGEVLAIDEDGNAVAYRAGEATVSYTYMAPVEPEDEAPVVDAGVIAPVEPGEDEGGEDATEPGEVEDGDDGDATEPGEVEDGEDGDAAEPGEVEDGEDGDVTEPGEVEDGEDGDVTEPGEVEDGDDGDATEPDEVKDGGDGDTTKPEESDTTPSEDKGETTPSESDDTNVTEASRVYYTGPEGGETEPVTVTWLVLVQDCGEVREIRALMQAFLDDYTEYANAIRAYVLGEELDTDLDFDEFGNRYGEMQGLLYTLWDMGIDWPAVPGTQEDLDLYDAVMKLVTGEAADLSTAGTGSISQADGGKNNGWGRRETKVYDKNGSLIYTITSQKDFWFHYHSTTGQVAYCVEPGIGGIASGTANWNPPANSVLNSSEIKELVNKVVACGYSGTYNDSWVAASVADANLWLPRNQAIATQLLVWEVIVGDRDINFNRVTHNINGTQMGYIEYAYSNSSWSMIGNICRDQYKAIVNAVRATCVSLPTETSGEEKHKLVKNGSNYETTLEFRIDDELYYKTELADVVEYSRPGTLDLYDIAISCRDSGVNVGYEVVNGNKLKITSSKPFSNATITIKQKSPANTNGLLTWSDGYNNGGSQDIVMLGGSTLDYTPKSMTINLTAPQATAELTLMKVATGAGATTNGEWTFKVTLTDENGTALKNQDLGGGYTTNNRGVVNNVKVTANDTNGVKLTVPIGTRYTVEEVNPNTNGYTSTNNVQTGKVENQNGKTVIITNTRGVGSLSLTKALDGDAASTDTGKVFNFTVTFTVPSDVTDAIMGNVTASANGQGSAVAPKKSGSTGSIWVATAVLHGGETATFKNLPAGTTYTVTEPGATQVGYDTKFEYSNTNKKITAENTDSVTVTNTRYNGNLAIKKVVEGEGDTTYPFHFEITLKDGAENALTGISYIKYDAQGKEDGSGTTSAGTTEFTLKHNEMIAFQDVPNTTTFTVTEKDGNGNGYVTTSKVDTNQNKPMMMAAASPAAAMMAAAFDGFTESNYDSHVSDKTTVTEQITRNNDWYIVTFTNSRETGSLTLTKDIDGNTESGDKGREWEFVVTLKDVEGRELTKTTWRTYTVGEEEKVLGGDGKLTLTHGQEAKFANLPYGTTYTIQESGQAATSGYKTLVSQNGSDDTAVAVGTVVTGMIGKTNSSKVDTNNTEIKDHTVKYTNAWTKGELVVTKTMGGDAAADEQVTFVITLDLSKADILKDTGCKVDIKELADWISGDDQSENVTTQFDETGEKWIVSITKDVKTDGKTIIAELGNIPTGVTYTVTETTERLTEEGYEVVYTTPSDNETSDKTTSGTITNDGEMDAIEVQDYRGVGTLVISKKVVSEEIIKNAGELFTFQIDLTSVPRSANKLEFLKNLIKVEVTDGEAKRQGEQTDIFWNEDEDCWTIQVWLEDGAKATISEIPAATEYRVREMEANLNGYVTTVTLDSQTQAISPDGETGKIENMRPDSPKQVDPILYTNTRFDGDLAVLKSLSGDGAYGDDTFEFTLELMSPYGLPNAFVGFDPDEIDPMGIASPIVDEIDPGMIVPDFEGERNQSWWRDGVLFDAVYTIVNRDVESSDELAEIPLRTLLETDGKFHFTLRGGEMIVFDKLPDQTDYTVTEVTHDWNGYTTNVVDLRDYGIMPVDDAQDSDSQASGAQAFTANGTLARAEVGEDIQILVGFLNHRGVGELAVSKLLVGAGADASRSWTFRVRLTDANGDPLTVNEWTVNGEEKQLTVKETGALVALDANGMTTLTMRGGETRTITNLPNGTRYTVEEVGANTDGYYTTNSGTAGTITEDAVSSVTFTNRREPGTLTVSKTVGGNAGDVYRPFEFVVTLTAPDRSGDRLPNPVKARLEDYREGTETELTLPLSEDNTVTFELTHDQAMVLLDLDEGTGYSVTETPVAGYVTRVAGDAEGILSANDTAVAAFTNTANVTRDRDRDDEEDETTRTDEQGPDEETELFNELPVPTAESPDTVTILEDDVPTTYVKVQDPETEEYMYIPEDDVPLFGFEIPETGDNGQTVLWAVLSAASLTGILALSVPTRKKKDEEEQ